MKPRRLDNESFIKRCLDTHGNKYDYSKVDYKTSNDKVVITCYKHGDWSVLPSNFINRKSGCPKCAIDEHSKKQTNSLEYFISRSKLVHGSKYDYSESLYIGADKNIRIICKEHGDFFMTPSNHYSGQKCPKCANLSRSKKRIKLARDLRDWNFEQPDDYKLIPLLNNKYFKVDNEDFDKLKDINWSLRHGKYPYFKNYGGVHRYIMNPPDDMVVDHINGDTLDNRRSNLRICTQQQNSFNAKPSSTITSSLKGVHWSSIKRGWISQIFYNGKQYNLGKYATEEEAGRAYDVKAKELFGEFAWLNFKDNG